MPIKIMLNLLSRIPWKSKIGASTAYPILTRRQVRGGQRQLPQLLWELVQNTSAHELRHHSALFVS